MNERIKKLVIFAVFLVVLILASLTAFLVSLFCGQIQM